MFNRAVLSKTRLMRIGVRLAALAPLFAAVYGTAFWLRFGDTFDNKQWGILAASVGWVVIVKVLVFGIFHVYGGWSRQVTLHDLLAIVKAAVCSLSSIWVIDQSLFGSYSISRYVLLLDFGGTILAVGGVRVAVRIGRERLARPNTRRLVRTFIAGADSTGEALLRVIRRSDELCYQVIGFLDCSTGRVGWRIDGVSVLGTLDDTRSLVRKHSVDEVLIVAGDLPGRRVRQLVDDCRQEEVRVTVLPSYEQLLTGRVAVQPRQVSIEDLLRREPVQLGIQDIQNWIDGRLIMITGSAGSIGNEICRQLLQFSPGKLVLVDRWENGQFYLERELQQLNTSIDFEICVADITDRERMRSLLERYRPEIIFHAAAYKHVPLMEANPGEAVKNILLATGCLADLADECGVESFVMISTDKAVQPTSVMGACKRVAEMYLQVMALTSSCRFITVRFGNVLDSAGSVVPIFREQISRGGPVTVTDPRMERFFMTIPEASQLVIQAGAMGQANEIFALDMGDPVRIVDLASDLIRLSGLRISEDIEIEFTGIRPGEKLCEKLFSSGEHHLPTGHPKIMIVEHESVPAPLVLAVVERLSAMTEESAEALVAELRRLVPEFRAPTTARHRLAA